MTGVSAHPSWRYFDGKSVLITGGTGSFGCHFVRTLLQSAKPRRLVIFSRDEMKQFEMQNDISALDKNGALRFFIGDVRDQSRLELALRGIEIVIHAAALKQVPTAEYNPFECIHTNVLGAEYVVQSSLKTSVKRVIALSTDKAASPINLYGASKLASDKIFIAANNLSGADGARFSVVRYGNVMGSRGSVIPLFQRLARDGARTIPITDERMTRFWITLPVAVDFVGSCVEMMTGGEIYVPKISEHESYRSRRRRGSRNIARDRWDPPGRKAARGDDHGRRRAQHGRVSGSLCNSAELRFLASRGKLKRSGQAGRREFSLCEQHQQRVARCCRP